MGPRLSRPPNTQLVAQPLAQDLPSPSNNNLSATTSTSNPLDDSLQLLEQDVEWLDEAELASQEDEDLKLSKLVSGELSEWLASRAGRNTTVDVTDPHVIRKYFGRKSVEYTVTTPGSSVKRRFRDFVALRQGLEVRYPGAVVPPLPPTPAVGQRTAKNLNKRRLGLQLFLRAVLRHAFLSADDLLVDFLTSTHKFDRTARVRGEGEAAARWAQALVSAASPPDMGAAVAKAQRELDEVHRGLSGVNLALKAHAARAVAYGRSLQDVASALHGAANVEYRLQALKADCVTALEAGQRTYSQQAAVVQVGPEEVYASFGAYLRYERWLVEAHARAVKHCRLSLARHQRAVRAYREAREAPEGSTVRGLSQQTQLQAVPEGAVPPAPNPDVEKLRARLQRLRLAAVEAQRDVRRDLRGVLVLELERFRLGRKDRLDDAFKALCQVHFHEAVAIANMWRSAGGVELPPNEPPSTTSMQSPSSDFLADAQRQLGKRRPSQLQVLYPFQSVHEDELNVMPGQVLQGVPDEADPNWVVCKDLVTGVVGLVPSSYVKVLGEEGGAGGAEEEEESGEDAPPPPGNPFAVAKKLEDEEAAGGVKREWEGGSAADGAVTKKR